MGDADGRRTLGAEHLAPACTTHFSVVDKDGNMAAVTQTLLSIFGSRLTLPESGVLMNNGIMWFDPRPGLPNSLGEQRVEFSHDVARRPLAATRAIRAAVVRPAVGEVF